MGSFRSQPDLNKYSSESANTFGNITFAVSHMCGRSFLTQAGASIWKTRILMFVLCPTRRILSLEYSTATEVVLIIVRSLGVDLHREKVHH